MVSRADIEEAFPEFDRIDDEQLREQTMSAWLRALEESDHEDLMRIPWSPKFEKYLGEQSYIEHIQETVKLSILLAEAVETVHDVDVDMDILISSALLHDIDKITTYVSMDDYDDYEDADTDIGELIKHPQYGVHIAAAEGLPVEIQHVVISHSGSTPVDPATLEAAIVTYADLMAADARFWSGAGHLMPTH